MSETNIALKSKNLHTIPEEVLIHQNTLKSLDVSLNNIKSLPVELKHFTLLTQLRLRGNQFVEFPRIILEIHTLKILDISSNSISSIPTDISRVGNLNEFICGQNAVKHIPVELGKMNLLASLSFPGNQLSSLPSSMSKLSHLTFLDLSNNNFEKFPSVIGKIPTIKTLWLFYNKLSELKGIDGCQQLNQLRVLHNRFSQIPNEIFKLTQLNSLEMDQNLIRSIPAEISQLKKLKGIAFTDCLIKSIPEEITQLTALSELIIVRSRIHEFPKFLSQLPKMCNLVISDSFIPKIEFTIDNCCMMFENNKITSFKCNKNDNVAILNLNHNKLKELPNTNDLQTLNELYLIDNEIQTIDQSKLHSQLRVLHLASNKISVFPEVGISYKELKELNLSNNGLSSLPSNVFSSLINLRKLYMAANNLSNLPQSIGFLLQLQELDLSHNKFTDFPQLLLHLTHLTNINLTNNLITQLPKNMSQLTNLQIIDLSCNNISSCYPIFGCTNLKSVSFAFNKQLTIPNLLTNMKTLEEANFIGTLPLKEYPLDVNWIKERKLFQISYLNSEKRESNEPQTIINTPLYFLKKCYSNQLKLPLNVPQFEENDYECPVQIGTSAMCGKRDSMQDTHIAVTNYLGIGYHLMALFDGHGGIDASRLCASQYTNYFADNLLKNPQMSIEDAFVQTFHQLNNKIIECGYTDGSAANVVLITPNHYFVSNVGDSRCLLIREDSICILNEDHTITNPDELNRIRNVNGFIDHGKVNGEIVLTRTLGDVQCQNISIWNPQIVCVEREMNDSCVVLCCDGIFDVLTNEIVGDICRKNVNQPAWVIASLIRDIAYSNGCKDNISCLVCKLLS